MSAAYECCKFPRQASWHWTAFYLQARSGRLCRAGPAHALQKTASERISGDPRSRHLSVAAIDIKKKVLYDAATGQFLHERPTTTTDAISLSITTRQLLCRARVLQTITSTCCIRGATFPRTRAPVSIRPSSPILRELPAASACWCSVINRASPLGLDPESSRHVFSGQVKLAKAAALGVIEVGPDAYVHKRLCSQSA